MENIKERMNAKVLWQDKVTEYLADSGFSMIPQDMILWNSYDAMYVQKFADKASTYIIYNTEKFSACAYIDIEIPYLTKENAALFCSPENINKLRYYVKTQTIPVVTYAKCSNIYELNTVVEAIADKMFSMCLGQQLINLTPFERAINEINEFNAELLSVNQSTYQTIGNTLSNILKKYRDNNE